jgi:hypothetical protein
MTVWKFQKIPHIQILITHHWRIYIYLGSVLLCTTSDVLLFFLSYHVLIWFSIFRYHELFLVLFLKSSKDDHMINSTSLSKIMQNHPYTSSSNFITRIYIYIVSLINFWITFLKQMKVVYDFMWNLKFYNSIINLKLCDYETNKRIKFNNGIKDINV